MSFFICRYSKKNLYYSYGIWTYLISYIRQIKKFVKDKRQYEWMRGVVLLSMCKVVGILSNKYGLTIRRFSNTFTAMLLIYVGKIMYQKMKLSFDDGYLAIVCRLVAFEVACMLGGVSLNGNEYKDILQLLVAAPAVLYNNIYW